MPGDLQRHHVRRGIGRIVPSVLDPIEKFLKRHDIAYRCRWVVGSAAEEILKAVRKEEAHLIVMGTHGHGLIGRALMGSVAQRVLVDCDVPVLLVK